MILKIKQNLLTLAIFTCIAGAVGCSSASKPATNSEVGKTNTNAEKPANDKTEPSTTNRDTPNIAVASGDKIGIPECDDYIEKYEACLTGKVPESARVMMKSSFEQTRKTWKDLAANPQTKSALGVTCKQAKDAAKQAMGAYHCDW